MATRIEKVLERVRDTLADPSAQRWSDARLLRILDEGQKDIAQHTRILKGTTELPLAVGQREYELPSEVYLITRATFDGAEIELATHDQMDEQARKDVLSDRRNTPIERHTGYNFQAYNNTDWEGDDGSTIKYVIYDRRELDDIIVYPIPNEDMFDYTYSFSNSGYIDDVTYVADTPYGVLTDVESPDQIDDLYGVTTAASSIDYIINDDCQGVESITAAGFDTIYGLAIAIEDDVMEAGLLGDELLGVTVTIEDYQEDSVYGLVADIHDPETTSDTFTTPYGVITAATHLVKLLKLWYIRVPAEVTAVSDDLELPGMFDTALKHYVVGNALRDDLDTQYQQLAASSLQFYDRELGLATKIDRQDGVRKVGRETSYRGAFE